MAQWEDWQDSRQHLPKYTSMGPNDLNSWENPDCKNKVSASPYRAAGVWRGGGWSCEWVSAGAARHTSPSTFPSSSSAKGGRDVRKDSSVYISYRRDALESSWALCKVELTGPSQKACIQQTAQFWSYSPRWEGWPQVGGQDMLLCWWDLTLQIRSELWNIPEARVNKQEMNIFP